MVNKFKKGGWSANITDKYRKYRDAKNKAARKARRVQREGRRR